MQYKKLGITDEILTCECCGKTNLKKTIVLVDELGNISYFGCECASQALNFSGLELKKQIEKEYRDLLKAQADKDYNIYKNAKHEYDSIIDAYVIEKGFTANILQGKTYADRKELGYFDAITEGKNIAEQTIKDKFNKTLKELNQIALEVLTNKKIGTALL